MDWKKCGKFIMKVASDVLLLLCLHDVGLWVSVGLGQATAFLYSEARLYKGPRQSPLQGCQPALYKAGFQKTGLFEKILASENCRPCDRP